MWSGKLTVMISRIIDKLGRKCTERWKESNESSTSIQRSILISNPYKHMNVVEDRSDKIHSQRLDKIDHIRTKKKITKIKFINCKREGIHWKIIKHIICIMHAYIQCHKLVKDHS